MMNIKQIYLNDEYADGIDMRSQYVVDGYKVDVYKSSTDQCTSVYVDSSIYGTFIKIHLFDVSKNTGWVSLFGDPIPEWLDKLFNGGITE